MENLFFECAVLGIDAILFGYCYSFYKAKLRSCKAVESARILAIDRDLHRKLNNEGDFIPYAVISGSVKAASNYLTSQYFSHIKGVIREKITKERKVRWNPMFRIWSTMDHDIQRSCNSVPFALSGTGLWFKSKVEVMDPLSAQELKLTTVYDHYVSHDDSISEMVAGWFRGERTMGIQEIENMLTENTVLTAVGELVLEDGSIKIKHPSSLNLTYFLTPLSVDSLIKKLKDDANIFKILSIALGCLGLIIVSSLLAKFYQARKRRIELAKARQRHQEASRQRRLTDNARHSESNVISAPKCVVCLNNPVEIIVLECGHACLCLDCSEMINNDFCPICRSAIDRLVPAYLP